MEVLEGLGASGLTVALVAVIRRAVEMSPRQSAAASLVAALIVTLAFMSSGAIELRLAPLASLQNWLAAMGAWSGGKALMNK